MALSQSKMREDMILDFLQLRFHVHRCGIMSHTERIIISNFAFMFIDMTLCPILRGL